MGRGLWIAAATVALFFVAPKAVVADPVNLGVLSFDVLVPSGSASGVNVFNILNFTGDPLTDGLALPPDFPVLNSLIFLNSSLTLSQDGVSTVISLGDIGPGGLSSTTGVEFPDFALFTSAVFTGTLSQTTFLLSDGTTFVAGSAFLTATLLPSEGSSLAAGTDLALITVSAATPAPIPEPSSIVLVASGIAALITVKTKRRV